MTQPMPMLPPRIAKLFTDKRGFPTPWFVTFFDQHGAPCSYGQGEPDFRVADTRKVPQAIRNGLCWVCGEKLGAFKAFVIGPMCTITRTSSEPPCHSECAMFSVQACPFLLRPKMRRNENDLPDKQDPPGYALLRNPGVACVWITKSFTTFKAQGGGKGFLLRIGDPTSVFWFCEGRGAKREEIMASIDGGYPALEDAARQERDVAAAIKELSRLREHAMRFVP